MTATLYNFLGLARKAHKVVLGEPLIKAIQTQRAKLVLSTTQVGKNQYKKISQKCAFYHVPYYCILDHDLTQQALGMENIRTIAIIDKNFAEHIIKLINDVSTI